MSESTIADLQSPKINKKFAKKKLSKVKLDNALGEWKPYASLSDALLTGNVYRIDLNKLSLRDLRLMRDDYQISACLNVITFTIQQVNWKIKASDKQIESFIEYAIRKIWNQLIRAISHSYWAGFSASVKVFENDRRSGKIIYKKFRDLAPETVKVVQSKDNTFNGFKQAKSQGGEEVIEPKYAFWYPFMMTHGNFYGEKVLKSAYIPWKFSQIIHLYSNRYYERFGEPTIIGRYPAGESVENADGEVTDAAVVMEDILETWRNHTSLSIPSQKDEQGNDKWVFDMLETNLYRGVDFEAYLKRLDMEKARAIFNPDLLFGSGRVGSYNLGVEQKNTFLVMLNAFVEDMKPYLNEYIIKPLVELNFAPKNGKEPWAEFEYEEFGKLKTDNVVQVVLALVKNGKIKLNADELGRHLGLTIEEVTELTEDSNDNDKDDDKKDDKKDKKVEASLVIPGDSKEVNRVVMLQFSRIKDQVTKAFELEGDDKVNALEDIKLGYRGKYVDILLSQKEGTKEEINEEFDSMESGLQEIVIESVKKGLNLDQTIVLLVKYFSAIYA